MSLSTSKCLTNSELSDEVQNTQREAAEGGEGRGVSGSEEGKGGLGSGEGLGGFAREGGLGGSVGRVVDFAFSVFCLCQPIICVSSEWQECEWVIKKKGEKKSSRNLWLWE